MFHDHRTSGSGGGQRARGACDANQNPTATADRTHVSNRRRDYAPAVLTRRLRSIAKSIVPPHTVVINPLAASDVEDTVPFATFTSPGVDRIADTDLPAEALVIDVEADVLFTPTR
jgi:hypothetical protein